MDKFAKEVQRFEFFVKYIWPIARPLVKHTLTPRCNICAISKKAPGVIFKGGVCEDCRNYRINPEEEAWTKKYIKHQQKELHEILTGYQKKGKGRYDALLLFSGGKDSTYMLFRIRQQYPNLRILLMTWDNGLYSSVSLNTVKKLAKKFDLDHILYKPRSSLYKSLYRYSLQHVDASGSYGTVDRLDGTLNQHIGLHYAAQLKIPLVISGVDWTQMVVMGSMSHFEHPHIEIRNSTLTRDTARRAGYNLDNIFSKDDKAMYWDATPYKKEDIPRLICPMVAWRPPKTEVLQVLIRNNLLLKSHTSPLITNNKVLPIMAAIDMKLIGYCSFEPEFCAMIRAKKTNPTYWRNVFEVTEYLAKRGKMLSPQFEKVLHDLGLTKKKVGL